MAFHNLDLLTHDPNAKKRLDDSYEEIGRLNIKSISYRGYILELQDLKFIWEQPIIPSLFKDDLSSEEKRSEWFAQINGTKIPLAEFAKAIDSALKMNDYD